MLIDYHAIIVKSSSLVTNDDEALEYLVRELVLMLNSSSSFGLFSIACRVSLILYVCQAGVNTSMC